MKCYLPTWPSLSNERKTKTFLGLPLFGVLSLLGGILVMITLGSYYSFGNFMTYMTSYMRQHSDPNITYSDFIIVQSTFGMTQGITMPLIGFIILRIGEKTAILVGCVIFSLGCTLTYFTIGQSLWMVALTYGFLSSVGQNLALIPTITTAMKWFPKHRGLVSGLIVSGYGGGSFIFNQIQTQFINHENFQIESSGDNEGYFTNTTLLERLPVLLLLLGGIYLITSLIGGLVIVQPSQDWYNESTHETADESIHQIWRNILKSREFYLLWIIRFVIPLFVQVSSGFYKTFGLTFILDDHFLSLVGTITSVFNCTGRLFYGYLMDKLTFKWAMVINTVSLMTLTSTLYCTRLIGEAFMSCDDLKSNLTPSNISAFNDISALAERGGCAEGEVPLQTEIVFAFWIWAIFFTFPGIYAMQPAVCSINFGQKYGGMAYSLLFTADIFSNFLIAMSSKPLMEATGFLGLFLSTSAFGFFALIALAFYPKYPLLRERGSEGDPIPLNEKSEHNDYS